MDFNPNLHHGLHQDQKLFHQQQEHNGSGGGGGYMDPYHQQRSHPHGGQHPMNMKQDVDVPSKVSRQMYDYDLQHHSPNLSDSFSQNPPNNPSLECSSPSPAPASAAAEYIRHQELNRSHPRKRIYQDWNQVTIFNTPADAEEGVRNFENCRWKVGNKFTSREGFKVYWSCREGVGCPVQIHLLYHSQLPRVVLYRNQPDHLHTERIKTRGLPAPVESLIRKLFSEGVNKPRRIQFILQKEGMEEVPQTKLSNFLVKLRREAAVHGDGGPVKRARSSYVYDDDEEEEDEQYGRDEDKSNHTMSSMSPSSVIFPSVVMNTPPGEEANNSMPMNQGINYHTQHHHQSSGGESSNANNFLGATASYGIPAHMTISSRYAGGFHTGGHGCGSENSSSSFTHSLPYAAGRSSDSVPPHSANAKSSENDADQSEVVTCSSSPPKTLYCRDETTEDGEQCLPDEEEVKDLIINHLRTNYSNRDMLHIRQELKSLKKENKYTALNRLLSFTAGFLQDTFLENHNADPLPEDE